MGVQILNKDVSILSSVLNKPKANIGNVFGIGGWTGGGGGGITPSPTPNWADVGYYDASGQFIYASQQIQGLSSTITLSVTYAPALFGIVDLHYLVTASPPFNNGGSTISDPSSNGFIAITTGGTFSVSNNQYVLFGVGPWLMPPPPGDTTVTVRNVTDSNTILDTFLATGA